jgi:hypothetical protein
MSLRGRRTLLLTQHRDRGVSTYFFAQLPEIIFDAGDVLENSDALDRKVQRRNSACYDAEDFCHCEQLSLRGFKLSDVENLYIREIKNNVSRGGMDGNAQQAALGVGGGVSQ